MLRLYLFVLLTGYSLCYPVCDICRGKHVGRPAMVMNVLYIGTASCKNYYSAGLRGQIPTHLCDVVQYYAKTVCECVDVAPGRKNYTVTVTTMNGT